MARVNLGTSASSYTTGFAFQRKILKTTLGKLFLLNNEATSGTGLRYKTSSDNGDTWDVAWISIDTIYRGNGDCSTIIDASNNIYVVYYYGKYFRKLTYSAGTWSIGSSKIFCTGNNNAIPVIIKRASGELFAASAYGYSGTWRLYGCYSTDDGATWNESYLTISPTYSVTSQYLCEVGGVIWCIFTTSTNKLKVVTWDDAGHVWNTPTDIVASGVTNSGGLHNELGALYISDTEIYAAVRTSSGIKIYVYNGSWDAGTLISNNANDSSPAITVVNGKPVICWSDYTGTQYNISYRKWNGSSWDIQVDLTSDVDIDFFPNTAEIDNDYLYVNYMVGVGSPYTMYFDKVRLAPFTQTIFSDAKIKSINNQQTILSDALIAPFRKTILSDAKIKVTDIQETILSDSKVVDQYQETILSDSKIKATGIQQTILSDALMVIEVLYNVNNKFTFVKKVLSDINNKFTIVKKVLSDINNKISFVKGIILNINNDFRTRALKLKDINNDVRFYKSWQKPTGLGFQSLGKTYIRVYIATVEQTDIDVDSIQIFKTINQAHTASFDLGRAYDATKPTIESLVEIKYNNWVLFKGYITEISPSEKPETITINCQDKYWLDNRTNKYFHVGHQPIDDKELYYSTIQSAILAEFGWNPGPGNFVPQIIDCFANGSSDALTTLIEQSGNYGWFYDVDFARNLWQAGSGSTINIDRQVLGTNLGLYQLLEHKFDENISEIVNKFRVQMGEKVIRKFNTTGGSKEYAGYNYSTYIGFAVPAWDSQYEILAKDSSSGYGWDYYKPENAYLYKDIFKKFTLPYLDTSIASWVDWKEPQVWVYGTKLYNMASGLLESGYTIDYEKRQITFNDAVYDYGTDSHGECTFVRAPVIKVMLWKREYWSMTNSPSDDPETDIANPLMFFTAKMGTYPTTTIKDLNLSNLTIQVGGTYVDADGVTQVVPSWDDTAFALDYANWELSKSCDKKITGTIKLTLDASCFYNIKLNNRIFINGITDVPMNINSISYNINDFTVNIELENSRAYNRSVSIQNRG